MKIFCDSNRTSHVQSIRAKQAMVCSFEEISPIADLHRKMKKKLQKRNVHSLTFNNCFETA